MRFWYFQVTHRICCEFTTKELDSGASKLKLYHEDIYQLPSINVQECAHQQEQMEVALSAELMGLRNMCLLYIQEYSEEYNSAMKRNEVLIYITVGEW